MNSKERVYAALNSKERVYAALNRKPADRVPIFMWYHPKTAEALSKFLEIPQSKIPLALGDDIRQTWVGNNHSMEGIALAEGASYTDPWGIEWVKEGSFNQIRRPPLQNSSDEEILKYRFPIERIEGFLDTMKPLEALGGNFFLGCDVSPCVFELLCRVRGMEETLMDIGLNPELAATMLERAGEFSRLLAERVCDRFKIDWLWTGDDVGGQQSIMMSPETWRSMVKPSLARIFKVAKAHGIFVAYHSCGSIRPIIPDLIEMGLDVLNPIQCNCPGMDPLELKKEFGGKLAFMGGVDTQGLLPNGSASEIRNYVKSLIDGMTGDGGGYILAASHTVPPETPLDNIFAMYEAAGLSREQIFDTAASLRNSGE